MGIVGLLGRLWLVMTKNQILLAHQELNPSVLELQRLHDSGESKLTQMAITPRRIVQSQICFRQFVRN
jgi:hypothetical protein